MSFSDLIPPLVVIVGGPTGPSPFSSSASLPTRNLDERSSSVFSASSGRSNSTHCTRLSTSTAPTSYRASADWTPAGKDALKQLCNQIENDHKTASRQSSRANSDELVAHGRKLKDELRKTKNDLKEKATALRSTETRSIERTWSIIPSIFRGETTTHHHHEASIESSAEDSFSFEAMLSQGPPSLHESCSTTTPDKEALRHQKLALKAQIKAIKEAEKLEKIKAAVQARNNKIDAQREKAAQKAAKKQAKAAMTDVQWSLKTKAEAEQIWGSHNIMTRSGIVRI